MKKPFIIHIQSENQELESAFVQFFQNLCSHESLVCKSIHFPSEGPLGHQLKVRTTNRIQYHPYPEEALILIDKMDFYFNPQVGVSVNPGNKVDILIIIETKQNKQDKIALNWLKEIQKILPPPDQEIKLKLPHDYDNTAAEVMIERMLMIDNDENLLQKPDFIAMLQRIRKGAGLP